MRKGYVYVILFALFIAVTQTIRYRIFIKKDIGQVSSALLLMQIMISLLIFLIPGLLLVRWYYKMKDKRL